MCTAGGRARASAEDDQLDYPVTVRAALLESLYSGHLFFVAVGVFATVIAVDMARLLDQRAVRRRVASVTILLAFALAIFAGPPLPLAVASGASLLAAAYVFAGFGDRQRRRILGAVAIAACVVAVGFELPHHVRRNRIPRPSQIIVIGDSLSSGGFGEKFTWPELLARGIAVPVANLSLASSTASMALERQLPALPHLDQNSCVIVAIGGNDMLDATDAHRFENDFGQLVARVKRAGNPQVVIVEIPLLPGRWAYGAVQRRVARKYGCTLLPKRIIAHTLLGEANTSDGIHLTQRGHGELARGVQAHLGW